MAGVIIIITNRLSRKITPVKSCNMKKFTGVLISFQPIQEGNKLMFLSEWSEFPSAPCPARKET